MSLIKLQSSENEKIFHVSPEIANMSETVKNMLEDMDDINMVVPLINVNNEQLELIIDFCNKYQNRLKEKENRERKEREREENEMEVEEDKKNKYKQVEMKSDDDSDINYWKNNFFMANIDKIFDILSGANYMSIKCLLDISYEIMANIIKDKTPYEIQEIFKIKSEFTPEEHAQIAKELAMIENK